MPSLILIKPERRRLIMPFSAASVTAWVQDHADQIELFYLPPYAPEHNLDEFLKIASVEVVEIRRGPEVVIGQVG